MTPVDKETLDFYELVERALEGLPPELSALLDNVAIVVDEWPDYSTPLVADDPRIRSTGCTRGCR
jgi:predicted Zn-dependent protease with MMP-like domain